MDNTNQKNCAQEIDVFIRARYPLVYVVSYEEQRVERLLARLAAERNKQLFVWSVTTGIRKLEEAGSIDENTRDPVAALMHIERQTMPAIFVLRDFHPYLNDQTVLRKLRELFSNLKDTYETVFIVSPLLNVPPELEKDIVVVDFDLPSKSDMFKLLDEIIAVVRSSQDITIDVNDEIKDNLATAALGLTLNEAENAFARAIVDDKKLGADDVSSVIAEKEQVIRKSGMLEFYRTEENLDNVGGLSVVKDWVSKRSVAFSDKAKEFGLPEPKGILLIGVQGCGKSLVCKSIARLWRMPLLRFDVGRVFSGMVGSSEDNMRRAIRTAESIAPAILWIDEIEKSLSGVQSSSFSDAGTSARVFSTFLTWMQEKKKPVFVVATANNISQLPPELLRKGRFDEIFFVDLPEAAERKDIFSIHIKKRKRDPGTFDTELLSRESHGYSGAEIEQVVISGLFDAFVRGTELTTDDLLRNIKNSVPLSQTMREDVESLRTWAKSRARPASAHTDCAHTSD